MGFVGFPLRFNWIRRIVFERRWASGEGKGQPENALALAGRSKFRGRGRVVGAAPEEGLGERHGEVQTPDRQRQAFRLRRLWPGFGRVDDAVHESTPTGLSTMKNAGR